MTSKQSAERVQATQDHYARFPYPSTVRTRLPGWLPRWSRRWLIKPKGRRYERALAELVAPERRALGRLLDAGCGTGEITVTVATRQRWGEVTGIDLTPRSLEIAEEYARTEGARIRFQQANLLEPETLPDGPYDAITSLGVIHHLPDPAAGLRNLAELLAPDGVMLLYFYGRLGRVGYQRRQELVTLLATNPEDPESRFEAVRQLGYLRPSPGGLRGLVLRLLGVSPQEMVFSRAMDDYANPNEINYTAPELVDLFGDCGLEVARWFRGIPPRAADVLPAEGAAKIEALPARERLRALDLVVSPASYTVAVRKAR